MAQQDTLEQARAIRRRVLGEAYVNESSPESNPLMRAKTELSEYVWANIWSRPGLDFRMRSAINLALLTALNRPRELKLHINGALNNGLSPDEIGEILLQCGAYCGIAAAKDSFAIMREVFAERGVG
jgi:4-carboxymuconolactone decarboxylase